MQRITSAKWLQSDDGDGPLLWKARNGGTSSGPFWNSSRRLLVVLTLAIVSYSAVILIFVANSGDPGFRCVFGRIIKERSERSWLPAAPGATIPKGFSWNSAGPQVGDQLRTVITRGESFPIEHYTDYVKALRAVRDRAGEAIEVRWESPEGNFFVGGTVVLKPSPKAYLLSLGWFLQEMIIFALVARAFWTRPHDVSARLFFWLCVMTIGAFMGGYHWSQIVIYRPLIFLFALFAVFLPVVSLHFYLVFPRINPLLTSHPRWVMGVLYGVPSVALFGIWTSMAFTALARDAGWGEVAVALYVLQVLALVYVGVAVVFFLLCLPCLLYSFIHAQSRAERNQVQWILLATLLALVPIAYLLWDVSREPARLGLPRSAWPMFVVSLLYTLAYALSLTRYRLMQAEAIFNRGVVYFLASLAMGLLYSGVQVVVGAAVFGEQFRTEHTSMGAVAAALAVIVLIILLEAARPKLQRAIDRRFYKEKYKLDQAMRKMSLAVGSLVDRSTMGRRLLEAADDVLQIEWGSLYLAIGDRPGGSLTLIAAQGAESEERAISADSPLLDRLRSSPTFRAPQGLGRGPSIDPASDALISLGGEVAAALGAEGAPAGVLVLGPKRSGMPYEDEEVAFLGALGSVAALALHSADIQRTLEGLNLELRDKVDKIAEQQRRILILQDQLVGRRGEEIEVATAGSSGRRDLDAEGPQPAVFSTIKGSSRAVKTMLDLARKVAASHSAVLIRGESGTGKELLAEAIHAQSSRAKGPFVKVHCAALSQNLLESELFGHVKGAYTDAHRDRVGRFQQADGGTLFLDEIGDISQDVQTKLLRVLQEMSFERVGSSQTISVDVRILAATHQDLERLIRAGRFREDLYYRLNVISLRTPSLRERREDIFELAVHFLGQHGRRAGKPVTRLDDSAIEALMVHDWPGNIRELENVIERAVVLADGPALSVDDLPPEVRRPSTPGQVEPARRRSKSSTPPRPARSTWDRGEFDGDGAEEFDRELSAFERRRLVDALDEAGGIKSEAARLLGMPRSTFFSKLRKHGLT